jgi:Plasmid pRiA4b ORF-3-like protein
MVEIYQIKVCLRGSQPNIWRRVQVKSDITLAKLHRILQCVMGWEDAHLHQFVIQGQRYGVPDQDRRDSRKTKDERKYELREIAAATNGQFVYRYDFGDDWHHTLEVEKTLPPEKSVRYPVCLAGGCACPPEDVGGIPGYENFLEAIADPKHPEHDELLEWIGGSFDPEAFNLNEVNRHLRAMH